MALLGVYQQQQFQGQLPIGVVSAPLHTAILYQVMEQKQPMPDQCDLFT